MVWGIKRGLGTWNMVSKGLDDDLGHGVDNFDDIITWLENHADEQFEALKSKRKTRHFNSMAATFVLVGRLQGGSWIRRLKKVA